MATEFIRVSARVRPSAKYSSNREVLSLDKTNVAIRASDNKMYQFDQIFDKDVDQATVFKEVGKRIIDGALEGINGTIFAYGQTGSGKTHTMLGPAQEEDLFNDAHQKGLMPRCFEYLFQQLEQRQSRNMATFEYTVTCMFVELYNEAITDLLTDSCPTVTIRAEAKNIVLQGAVCETISSFIDATRLLRVGWDNRRVGETAMNKESSRSHAVLTVDVVQTEDDGGIINKREARINLVDLAGSERQSQTKASGTRLKEAGKINQSLGTLGRVIRELSSKGAHIPYRDSKLTLMIRDSLGGNSRTAVIVCVHPDEDYYAESLSTLKFAEHCRMVKNEFHINRQVTGKSIDALQAKVVQLEEQLNSIRNATAYDYEVHLKKVTDERDAYKRELEKRDADLDHKHTPTSKDLALRLQNKRHELAKLEIERDKLALLAETREVLLVELQMSEKIMLEEKSKLESKLLREQDQLRILETEKYELTEDVEQKRNEIIALKDKLAQNREGFHEVALRRQTTAAESLDYERRLSFMDFKVVDTQRELEQCQTPPDVVSVLFTETIERQKQEIFSQKQEIEDLKRQLAEKTCSGIIHQKIRTPNCKEVQTPPTKIRKA